MMPSLIEPPRIPELVRNLILDMDGVLWCGETLTALRAPPFLT